MSAPPLSRGIAQQTIDAFVAHGTKVAAARALGIPVETYKSRLVRAEMLLGRPEPPPPFTAPEELPTELPTVDELLQRRSKQFAKKRAAKDARVLVPVNVHIEGPIGIAHFGDPHVDDDGTDIDSLQRDVALVNKTEGLFAGSVGDYSNNWVGRLARLYGEQSTSAREAWVLVEWLIHSVRWLYLIGGNHDLWSGAGDPIQWMSKSARVQYEEHGIRMGLTFPNGRVIRINARHDFSGHSMWNTAHGPSKAAQLGWRDHILIAGDKHVSGYNVLRDPSSGLISHAIRVGTYKVFDRFAESKGLPNQNFSMCPVTIIDPEQPDDSTQCVHVCFDSNEGADYLTWKRKKWARKRA